MLKKVSGCALWLNPHDVSGIVCTHITGKDHRLYVYLKNGEELYIGIKEDVLEEVWNSITHITGGPEKPGNERF